MILKLVNPNTTVSMTRVIEKAGRAAAGPDVDVVAATSKSGPASIESHYDEALSVPGLLAEITGGGRADGFVVACFGDPGLDAAREVAPGPVVGIAEAGMRAATYLGRTFGVVTTLARSAGRTRELVDRYGVAAYCGGVRATDIPVLDLEHPNARARVLAECRAAIETDGAEVVVLGCAGMADLCADLRRELGVPVIDGVAAAVAAVEGLVRLGLDTSRGCGYARPPAKHRGPLAGFKLRSDETEISRSGHVGETPGA
ncbi:aspartate/glutamate racemase family protein [Actinospica sp.]|uniref:aspartate/glutamate racemase family protein n=1 Tax=Actinospica sp. TaxID=1872142 RepID=UPI002C9AB4B8|nr:aspartate/glutamate racemase family protein [Actinospica sp.]HWG26304.1 aspartate/glutamate racemase family protein [Actinospica sp.]